MSTETIIFIGVGLYLAVMLTIGIYASRRAGNTADFIVAGRRLPIWIGSATIIATWFGGGTMMGSAGASYERGLLGVIADPFGGALCLFIVGFFFARLFRRLRLLTFIDFFQNRYGTTAATIAAVGSISSNIGWTGALLVAFGYVFETLTGVPMELGIMGGAIVVFIYTVAGGMWAVAMTDFVQMAVIAVGLVLLLVVVLIDVGGWSNISEQLPEDTFRMIPLDNTAEVWLNYIRAWLIFGLADVTAQTLMQRAFSAKNEQVAQNSFYLAGFGHLSLGLIPVTLGIIASVTMPELVDPETVIPELALAHLHPVAIAIFVGALLAAIMSSADSALLAAASVFSVNILPLFKPKASDRFRLLATRIAIPAFGSIAVYVALEVQVVYDLILDSNSVILVCVTVPFIVGVWWKRANRSGALASMAMGFLTWFVAILFAPEFPGDLLGLLVGLVTIFVVTPLTQKTDPPVPLRNGDGEEVEFKDRLGTLPLFRRSM
ncbi:MAG: sodium:solute symporter family protein [Gammaproteobacteria bacterium]|nr:sodium:solute symporter family protein [Gammaproteobacteria bacterium]